MAGDNLNLRLPELDTESRYVKSGEHSHLDALRVRELSPGYRLLSTLRGRTPTTVCSAVLAEGVTDASITTLVLDEIKVDGVDDSAMHQAVDRIVSTHDIHPAFSGRDQLPALVAIWAGMVVIKSENSLPVVQVCKVASEMTESDALARIVQNDFELRPVSGRSGWVAVEKAGLWVESFKLINAALWKLKWAEGEVSRERLMALLRGFTKVVQEVADEISDGMFDGLPGGWVEDTVSDIVDDLREELNRP